MRVVEKVRGFRAIRFFPGCDCRFWAAEIVVRVEEARMANAFVQMELNTTDVDNAKAFFYWKAFRMDPGGGERWFCSSLPIRGDPVLRECRGARGEVQNGSLCS